MEMISAPNKAGGAHLLVHPGEDASWGWIVVAAPRCSLLRATEELGLCKADKEGNMILFSFHDRDSYSNIDSIHAYFGGSIAFYFSFLDFYTWALVPPAIVGLFIIFFLPAASPTFEPKADNSTPGPGAVNNSNIDLSMSSHMVQALFSMIWSTVFIELWKRRSAALSYRWGTLTLTEHFQEPRPGFQGEVGINPVTGRTEPLFPDSQRQMRIGLVSVPVVGLFLSLVVLGMMGFYYCESTMASYHNASGSIMSAILSYLPSIIHIVYTNMLGNAYRTVALRLTDWENHREESSFQNHHTAKVLVFTFFNNFAVLFHIAIFKQDLHLLHKRLSSLLILSQLVNQFTELVVPYIIDRFYNSSQKQLKEDDPAADHMQAEGSLPPFPGLFLEYIELLVQFGYLSLFSCVYPLTALLLLINNITEIRGDAYKICHLFRKPFSPPEAGIGVWQVAFEVLSFFSVMSNCWLLFLDPQIKAVTQDAGLSPSLLLIFIIMVEHVLIVVKLILAFIIPDEPDWVRIKREQIEYCTMKALKAQDSVENDPVTHSEQLAVPYAVI
ncbi:Anoctamin-10 [Bagarius yarrelli]|uniref:Anoctamin n=1 Tax=Bagarius yarrelli TaxID=175774 RepID=A0A556V0P5_BAGYA|nr:Anoctamin-10 [Bagarius yarrelli]